MQYFNILILNNTNLKSICITAHSNNLSSNWTYSIQTKTCKADEIIFYYDYISLECKSKTVSYKPQWSCSIEADEKMCPRDRLACLDHMSQTAQYWDAHPSPTTHQCDPFTDGKQRPG